MMENQRALVSSRRFAQIADLAKTLGRAADMGRVKTLVQCNTLRAKRGHQSLTVQTEPFRIVLKTHLVIARPRMRSRIREWLHTGQATDELGERLHRSSPLPIAVLQLVQLRQQHSRLQFGERADQIAA